MEEPGKVHGRDRLGIVGGSCVCLIRGVSIRGKLVLSRNQQYKTRGVDMWLNVVLTPRKPIPKSKFRYGTYRCELWVLLPPLPLGESVFGENSFYRTPGGKWAQETSTECLQQRYAMVEPGKVQGRDRMGILGCPVSTVPAGLYSQKIRFIEKPGVQDWWGRHVSKRSSDHRVDNPEVKILVRDLVELWVILISLPHRGSIFGENSFYRAPGCKLAQKTCGGCPKQCKRLRRAKQSSGTVPCGDCRRGLCVSDPWGQYSGKIRFIETPEVQD